MENRVLYRFVLILLIPILLIGGLFLTAEFLIPVVYSALLAMLLLPVCSKLEDWGLHRILAIILCLLLLILVIGSLAVVLSGSLMSITENLPGYRQQLVVVLDNFFQKIYSLTGITPEHQGHYLKEEISNFLKSAGSRAGNFLIATTKTLVTIGLVIVYIFCFLFYREKFVVFLHKITPAIGHVTVTRIILQVSKVSYQYLLGMLIVILILSILNTLALWVIGIPNPLFYGVLTAILNIVPYVGIIVGSIVVVLVALLNFSTIWPAVAVAALFSLIQFIDNNLLTPNIVGGHVKLNPLASIMALIIGGLLWGVAGMILFIPLLGILKIIFDNIEQLKPYGYLIGEENELYRRKRAQKSSQKEAVPPSAIG